MSPGRTAKILARPTRVLVLVGLACAIPYVIGTDQNSDRIELTDRLQRGFTRQQSINSQSGFSIPQLSR